MSAKGERAALMGYGGGLEMWAYPLQLLSGYRLRFHVAGQVASIEADTLLRRVERRPTEAVRVYVGQDFVVRERLFVPRQAAGAILSYEVAGRPDVQVEAVFRPSLDLMWPGALGGQSVAWDDRLGYVEREPLHGFTATISSPEAIGHDAITNRARPPREELAMLLQPRPALDGSRLASLYVAADPPGGAPVGTFTAALRAHAPELRRDSASHAESVLAASMRITTPDPAVDRALASATLALDQAWVCNAALGCGEVAGYGPSRPGRRPQYAWFFAGDGLVAMLAMLDAGQYERAREELEFIARYQNKTSGMIWHEISQSAPLINWVNRYPYMFVHVDITFQYLAAVQSYVEAAGDVGFAREQWRALAAAYHYCTSLIDPATGLPRIPEGKQGQNEQEALHDDIRLSSAWIDAADGFARLARATGHGSLAVDAEQRATRARASIARDGWDPGRGFWLSGHTLGGAPVHGERSDAVRILDQGVFDPKRIRAVLDRIASPEFATDWGVRNLSSAAAGYDPNLYGAGSVWALGTAGAVTTLWNQHRPLAAWDLWRGLAAWNTLDSAGHLHELLAGDLFHPEVESVPEQTWSSAGLLSSAVHGLLGIEVHASEHLLRFAPHLPARWDTVGIAGVRVGASRLNVRLIRDELGVVVRVENAGPGVDVEFDPAVPLGATLGPATVDGVAVSVTLEPDVQDQHARLRFTARHGVTQARIAYEGGVEIASDGSLPRLGEPSREPKIVSAVLMNMELAINAWVGSPEHDFVDLVTAMRLTHVDGGQLERLSDHVYRLHLAAPPDRQDYRRTQALIGFAR